MTAVEGVPARTKRSGVLRQPLGWLGLLLLLLLVLFGFVGGRFWRLGHEQFEFESYESPVGSHPFGTDELGGDMLAQLIRGTALSLPAALGAAAVAAIIGGALGAWAGYLRKRGGEGIAWFIDLVLITASVTMIVMQMTRIVPLRWADVVELQLWGMVAHLLVPVALILTVLLVRGARRHVSPDTWDMVVAAVTIAAAFTVLNRAIAAFPRYPESPEPLLGVLLLRNRGELVDHPWLWLAPFAITVLIPLAVYCIGTGVRNGLRHSRTDEPVGSSGQQ